MVFTSVIRFIRSRGPDEFWRKRKILRLSAVRLKFTENYLQFLNFVYNCFQHFYGRKRNCYDLAIRTVHRALQYSTKNRELRRDDLAEVSYIFSI